MQKRQKRQKQRELPVPAEAQVGRQVISESEASGQLETDRTEMETAGAALLWLSPAPIAVAAPPIVAAAKKASCAPVPIAQEAAIEREVLTAWASCWDEQIALYDVRV